MLPRECYTSEEFFAFEREAVFARSWVCVGRVEQIANPGDYLAANVAGEPLLVVRTAEGSIKAMSAVCRHRGEVLTCTSGSTPSFRCPLHFWSYDLNGRLIGAPRMPPEEMDRLRKTVQLPPVRHEVWHGFIFIDLDASAAPLAPSLAKLEPCFEGYPEADMAPVPPVPMDKPLPWNWKVHLENFTDAYHPEFVHKGTHDFAPSNLQGDGVEFTSFDESENAILRSVPLRKPAPGAIAYTLVGAGGAEATYAASDRQTGGGWLLPKSTLALPDFAERAATVREGASKIWAQDIPVNVGMQAGKRSRFMPDGYYAPLEVTLRQFNAWLLHKYRGAIA